MKYCLKFPPLLRLSHTSALSFHVSIHLDLSLQVRKIAAQHSIENTLTHLPGNGGNGESIPSNVLPSSPPEPAPGPTSSFSSSLPSSIIVLPGRPKVPSASSRTAGSPVPGTELTRSEPRSPLNHDEPSAPHYLPMQQNKRRLLLLLHLIRYSIFRYTLVRSSEPSGEL